MPTRKVARPVNSGACSDKPNRPLQADEHYNYAFGVNWLDSQTACFRLWAPGMADIKLEIDGQDPLPMTRSADGFHHIQAPCSAGALYRYRLNSGEALPDPASRLQAGDVHDASVVLNNDNYDWQCNGWHGRPWTDTVLYEIHPGIAGGFTGIQQRLAALAELGITAIELMPVADFPGPRNWGYDGVLPYAPDTSYGTPAQLKQLIDAAHGLNMMVFLDVVYNHFGPEGNYVWLLAPEFFRSDLHTPWGPAIDFRKPQVRQFFAENALYWLTEYRFDGLRLDAVHAISDASWLPEMAEFVRRNTDPARHVHLILENDDNIAGHMLNGFDAQWNDDGHHVLHHLLTGETQGYYAAYAFEPAQKLARFLAEGFVYQGDPSVWRNGAPRGEPSGHLPPSAFVLFLQNHDQTGNRAFGERLNTLVGANVDALRATIALQLLCPQIPLLFMGEECGSTIPFLYFTGYDNLQLARAVRDGRRKEFAHFPDFSDPLAQARIPDPNAPETYACLARTLDCSSSTAQQWRMFYRNLLAIRHRFIMPQLPNAQSLGAQVLGSAAVRAQWQLANGSILTIYTNLARESVSLKPEDLKPEDLKPQDLKPQGENTPTDRVLFESTPGATSSLQSGILQPACTIAILDTHATGEQP